jgi:hypothetical protein
MIPHIFQNLQVYLSSLWVLATRSIIKELNSSQYFFGAGPWQRARTGECTLGLSSMTETKMDACTWKQLTQDLQLRQQQWYTMEDLYLKATIVQTCHSDCINTK